jgi:hypothetical protein
MHVCTRKTRYFSQKMDSQCSRGCLLSPCTRAVDLIRVGTRFCVTYAVLAPRAVVEVSRSLVDTLGGRRWLGSRTAPYACAHAKAPHALVLDELHGHEALPTNQGLHSVDV